MAVVLTLLALIRGSSAETPGHVTDFGKMLLLSFANLCSRELLLLLLTMARMLAGASIPLTEN